MKAGKIKTQILLYSKSREYFRIEPQKVWALDYYYLVLHLTYCGQDSEKKYVVSHKASGLRVSGFFHLKSAKAFAEAAKNLPLWQMFENYEDAIGLQGKLEYNDALELTKKYQRLDILATKETLL